MKIHGYFKTETIYREEIEITKERFNQIIKDYAGDDLPLDEVLEDDIMIMEALSEAGLITYRPKNATVVDGGVDYINLEIID